MINAFNYSLVQYDIYSHTIGNALYVDFNSTRDDIDDFYDKVNVSDYYHTSIVLTTTGDWRDRDESYFHEKVIELLGVEFDEEQ